MISISEGPTKIRLTGEQRDLRLVAQKLRYHPLGYFHSPKFKAYQLTDGHEGWDGFLSPVEFSTDGSALCDRGHKDKVLEVARANAVLVNTQKCLTSPFADIVADDIPDDLITADFKLDEYQRESVAYWLRNGMGINKIAINGGKTAMFAATAAMVKNRFGDDCRIIYMTQTERLVRQAYKDLRGFLPGWDITQYGGGKSNKTGKDIVVCTTSMLWKNHAQLVTERWFSTFMVLLYDESHHVASDTSSKLVRLIPAFFRLGASDSQREKNPGDVCKIRGLLGPIRYTVPVSVYIKSGRSARPTIYIVEKPEWRNRFNSIPHQAEPGTPAWALVGSEWKHGTYVGPVYELDENGEIKMRKKRELEDEVDEGEMFDEHGASQVVKTARWTNVEVPVTVDGFHTIQFDGEKETYEVESTYCLLERVHDRALTRFRERNELIGDWTQYYSVEKKFPTLVVCTRTLHIYILQNMLCKRVGKKNVKILLGGHTSRERDAVFDWFRHTPGSVLISPLVQEGVSINEIRGGVIADYIGDWERANQIIGRFIRKKPTDNNAHITWFVDNQHDVLRRGCTRVINRLIDIRGYKFAYPLQGPETIESAKVYESLD